MRPDVTKQNPGKAVTEIAKILGEMWQKVSEKDKASWKEGKAPK